MSKPKNLYKTVIVIWSKSNGNDMELSTLAREAECGDAYCSKMRSKLVKNPTKDEDWDGTEFFGVDE
jgi:hypothetical protein